MRDRRHSVILRSRARFVVLCGILAWVLVLLKLFHIQVLESERFQEMAINQENMALVVEAQRGEILDRHGLPLASSVAAYPEHGTHAAWVLPRFDRVFTYGHVTSKIVGLVGYDGRGLEGVEARYDPLLRGSAGRILRPLMGSGHVCTARPTTVAELGIPGERVVLTMDTIYQTLAQSQAESLLARANAQWTGILIMNPVTGEILAAATAPTLDPTELTTGETLANPLWSFAFEPGSSFKIVALSAALENDLVDTDSLINCEEGTWLYGGRPWHDTKPIGIVPLRDAVAQSSNIAAAKLATQIGGAALYAKACALGFGQPTGAELHAEVSGTLRCPTSHNYVSTAAMAIGHEVLVTPIQLLNAFSCIANHGLLIQPTLVGSTTEAGGVAFVPIRRALTTQVAARMTELLEGVVRYGTGREARHPRISVAGKTGTAQKASPHGGGYDDGRYVSTFVGFFPSQKPCAAMLVIVDEPCDQYYGGTVCAPVFRRMIDLMIASPGGCLYPELSAALSIAPMTDQTTPAKEPAYDPASA
jgi:cell division protein FtsI (penicillin-binding protein 3)